MSYKNRFKVGDRIRVPAELRQQSMPDRIKFMADGRVETVTQVFESAGGIQLVSVDFFDPRVGSGWFELAE